MIYLIIVTKILNYMSKTANLLTLVPEVNMFNPKKVLIPYPQKISDSKGDVKIGTCVTPYFKLITIGEGIIFEEAVKLFWSKLKSCCAITNEYKDASYEIRIVIDPSNAILSGKSEAYTLNINTNTAVVSATDEAGAYYGVVTLTNLMHTSENNVYLPMVEITDYPRFKDRGQFLECRYGSDFMTKQDYKNAIDYFASLKQNALTIGIYGCWSQQYDLSKSEYLYIPFKKYPFLKTPRNIKYYSVKNKEWVIKENVYPVMFEEDFFGELVEYGKRKNITVKPLINSLGHNSLIPRMIPETATKHEDGTPVEGTYAFCTENEKTIEVMCDLYDEIIDRYILPYGHDSIQIGLDEVWWRCECEKCHGVEHTELMIRYIIKLCKHLKKRGMKNVYLYHDMLFEDKNVINEELKQRFIKEDIYDIVVIDWWNYRCNEFEFVGKKDEVNNIFRSIIKPMTGYFHWTLPPEINENIRRFAIMADKLDFEGIEPYGAYEECFDKNFSYSADLSWNPSTAGSTDSFEERYAAKIFPDNVEKTVKVLDDMREIMFMIGDFEGNLIGNLDYYRIYSYTSSWKEYPEGSFKNILENTQENMAYLKNIYNKATNALELFSEGTSHLADVWKLLALHYSTYADIFYELTDIHLKWKNGEKISSRLKAETARLIERMNELMSLAEDVRIEATSFVYLRNMSLMRQFLIDLQTFVDSKISEGKEVDFDISDFTHFKSDIFNFIR